jgi:hypothetical protein
MAAIKSSGYQIQHLAVDHAEAVCFREIFDLYDGWIHELKGLLVAGGVMDAKKRKKLEKSWRVTGCG